MKYSKFMAWAAIAAGLLITGAQAKAAEPYHQWDIRHDRMDLRHDYARADFLRNDIAQRRDRMAEDYRCGRRSAAAQERRAIERDEAELRAQNHDIHADRSDLRYDYRTR